ncbi:thiazolylpeptide-type bacteriocin [Pseudorhodoferax sp.]|uniref:thiazolylpeptide-type bacteriocin n=1 Tax=Pseudorhodoferax sp. TaxID=1993553 RepID=UPI002DD69355|nr:thiazolylpeptide-type bacteriocin [Pseudorhodoferax sp.]
MTQQTQVPQTDLSFDDIDVTDATIEGLEVVTVKDALALPETGASSGSSSCGSCSTCGSSSCCIALS